MEPAGAARRSAVHTSTARRKCRFEALHLFRTPTGLADGLALKELARLSMRGLPQWPKPPLVPPFRSQYGFGVAGKLAHSRKNSPSEFLPRRRRRRRSRPNRARSAVSGGCANRAHVRRDLPPHGPSGGHSGARGGAPGGRGHDGGGQPSRVGAGHARLLSHRRGGPPLHGAAAGRRPALPDGRDGARPGAGGRAKRGHGPRLGVRRAPARWCPTSACSPGRRRPPPNFAPTTPPWSCSPPARRAPPRRSATASATSAARRCRPSTGSAPGRATWCGAPRPAAGRSRRATCSSPRG